MALVTRAELWMVTVARLEFRRLLELSRPSPRLEFRQVTGAMVVCRLLLRPDPRDGGRKDRVVKARRIQLTVAEVELALREQGTLRMARARVVQNKTNG